MARKRFNFWLDDKRADDWKINELITTLKGAGQFTRAIREGLRLWVDLRAGNTTVLTELFPFIADKLTPPAPAPATGGGGHSELAKEIAAQIVLMGGTSGYMMQSAAAQPTTGKQIAGFKALAAPVEDSDDLPELVIKKDDSMTSTNNFMNQLKGMHAEQAPPKAVAQKAKAASADEIADNFLSQFGG